MLTPSAALEALLFASGEAMEKKRLASLLGLTHDELRQALDSLASELPGRGIALIETEQDVELRTSPHAAALVKKYRESELSRDLGRAALETLAAVAYGDGATKSEIDWIRGVNSSTSVRTLLLRGLIEGREDPHDRRRIRYALTGEALAHLGVSRLSELPQHEGLSVRAHRAKEAAHTEGVQEGERT